MADKLYMVVNIGEAETGRYGQCYWLPPKARPSVLHWYREDAEREAERLSQQGIADAVFAVMELVCEVHAGPLMPVGPLVRVPIYIAPPETSLK